MVSHKEALRRLIEGNERFRAKQPLLPPDDLSQYVAGQAPIAAVLSCADSRVPLELIFNQSVGALFVVRVAGNIAGDSQIGSLEFAVNNLGCNLVVVLGHTHCGAVKAALGNDDSGVPPSMLPILAEIRTGLRGNGTKPEPADGFAATKQNVVHTQNKILSASTILQHETTAQTTAVVGGLYDIESGKVDFFDS
ncbi:MAG: carbonic anhydrase [Pseudomonadales bacterium]|nr:carbonic anhydrase [Pseudomonadales bacterium]